MTNISKFTSFDMEMGAENKISPSPDFDGPVKYRKITDPLFAFLLVGAWGVSIWLGVWSIQHMEYSDISKTSYNYITRFMNDLYTSKTILIGVGLGGSTILSLMILALLRIPSIVSKVIWMTTFLVPLCLGGLGTLCWFLIRDYESDPLATHSNLKVIIAKLVLYTSWVLSGLSIAAILFFKSTISEATKIAKAGSRAIREVKFSILLPVFQAVSYTAVVCTIGLWLLFISTSGNDVTVNNVTSKVMPPMAHYAFWVLLFILFWTSEFIVALGQISLSMCFSKWYYTPEKTQGNEVSVYDSTMTTLSKHFGSAAIGSFFVWAVQIIRSPIVLTQKLIRKSSMDNKFIDIVICSCQCCLFGLERFLKYTSAEAYVHTAIFGNSFCKGSHESYYLLLRNYEKIPSVSTLRCLSVFFCKAFISLTITILTFVSVDILYAQHLSSILSVCAISAIISWFIGDFFMETLGVAVSSVVHSYLIDVEMMGKQGPNYVTEEITEFLNSMGGIDELELIEDGSTDGSVEVSIY